MFLDPSTRRELSNGGLVELALGGIVDAFDARLAETKLRLLECARHAFVVTVRPFGVDEHGEAFVEAECRVARSALLLEPCSAHALEA